jgi:hypothetical protein
MAEIQEDSAVRSSSSLSHFLPERLAQFCLVAQLLLLWVVFLQESFSEIVPDVGHFSGFGWAFQNRFGSGRIRVCIHYRKVLELFHVH